MEIIYFRGSLLLCWCRWLLGCHIEFYGDSLINFQTEIIFKKKRRRKSVQFYKNWWCSMMMWHQDMHFVLGFLPLGSCFLSLFRIKRLFLLQEPKLWSFDSFLTVASSTPQYKPGIPVDLAMKTKARGSGKFKRFLWENQGDKSSQGLLQTGSCQTSFF